MLVLLSFEVLCLFIGHVDEDHWLKFDNGSLAWEVVFVSLFHLGGQRLHPSPVLSLPK
jgi:hypothetical protein